MPEIKKPRSRAVLEHERLNELVQYLSKVIGPQCFNIEPDFSELIEHAKEIQEKLATIKFESD